MAVVYRCGVCRTTSKPGDGHDALQARDEHRQRAHHGQIPDGETIETWRGEPGQEGGLRGCLIGAGGILLLAAYGWLRRHG